MLNLLGKFVVGFALLSLFGTGSAHAQISVRSDATSSTPEKSFFYHWNGFNVSWFGPSVNLVKSGDLEGVPASGKAFTQGYSGNTFGYKMTAVETWDTDAAIAAINASAGQAPESSAFRMYLDSLTPAVVDRHGGSQHGFGVNNLNNDVDSNRRDKIDDVGEALIITFDLEGVNSIVPSEGSYGPGRVAQFQNTGLHEYAELTLSELYLRKYGGDNTARVDFMIYDASEGAFVTGSGGQTALIEYFNFGVTAGPITGPWKIEHGDILILAHPTDPSLNLSQLSAELWSMTFDLDFNPPAPEPIEVPSDPADFPQHQYAPGFLNTWRTDGELVAAYHTEEDHFGIRTVVQDFHRGYLMTENRSTTIGQARIFFDIADVTSENPSEPLPENRTPREVFKLASKGQMHTAYQLLPDYRVNHPGDYVMNLSGLSDPVPTIVQEDIPGYVPINSGHRSAYIYPYVYASTDDGKFIRDSRTGETLSTINEHGWGNKAMPMPVGNIMVMSKLRGGDPSLATFDVSDPRNPVLLDLMRDDDPRWRRVNNASYEPALYKHYAVLPSAVNGASIGFVDYSDPHNLRMHHSINGTQGANRYVQFQDHRMFAGKEVIDLTHIDGAITPTEHYFEDISGEYLLPLGNLLVCGENTGQGPNELGAYIYAFQAEPDVRAPSVSYHIPKDGATGQLITSRIGLIIHDTLDLTTITTDTFKVFPVSDASETSIDGTLVMSDKDVITFTPDQPLDYNTTYRVVVDGFTDIVSNPVEPYSFEFTTAAEDELFYPDVEGIGFSNSDALLKGVPVDFFFNATASQGQAPSTLEYRWDFGDGTITGWSNANAAPPHIYEEIGDYNVRAHVRSVNAPHLVAMAQPLTISVFQKPVGEDGFQPRFEAEDYATGSISQDATASNGAYASPRLLTFDFLAVRGVFDMVVRIAHDKNNSSLRLYDVFFAEGSIDENGNIIYGEWEFLETLSPFGNHWRDITFTRYFPRTGNYKLEFRETVEGHKRPRLDYVDILIGDQNLKLESELLAGANITNGTISADANASGGSFVEGQSGFNIGWDFYSEDGGSHTIAFGGHSDGTPRSMGIFVNGTEVGLLTYNNSAYEERIFEVDLIAGQNNFIELRDTAGTGPLNLDYLTITIPPYVKPEVLLPFNSSQLALDSENREVITVNPDNNTVTAINADTLSVAWERIVPGDPRSVGIDSNGFAWVTCHDGDVLRIIDPLDPANDESFDTGYGSAPHDIVFNRDRTRAFVSLSGNAQVIQIDTETRNVVNVVATGPFPSGLALSADGEELLVTRFISPEDVAEVYEIAIDPDTEAMTMSSVINLQTDTTTPIEPSSGRGLPNYLSSIVIHPTGNTAYVASQQANTVGGLVRDGSSLNHDSTVRTIVSQIDLENGLEDFPSRLDLDDSSLPTASLFAPGGDLLFVALQGNNVVSVLDLNSGDVIYQLQVGNAPQGLLFDPETNRLFVKNFLARSVTVHDLSEALSLGNFTDTNPQDIVTVSQEVLDPEILLGKQIFFNAADERMGLEGYLSCASCHQHGGEDGIVWDFTQRGEGLRNTIDLRGRAGMAHGRVHWSGNFDEIQDFELDIVNHQGGQGFIADGEPNPPLGAPNAGRSVELDALAAYVSSLDEETIPSSPFKDADGTLSAAALQGQAVFNALDCMACHEPITGYTDSATGVRHDVGTLKATSGSRLGATFDGVDTPTLLGLFDRAPYFHDGSAATLVDVFDPTGDPERAGEIGQVHDLSGLDGTQFNQLVAYLLELDGGDVVPNLFPVVTTSSLIDGTVGSTYAVTLSASSGNAPLTWSILGGTLPAGLSLDPATGEISGTATAEGSASFTVQVSDLNGDTDSEQLTIVIDSGFTPPVLGDMYAHTFDGSGASLNGTTVDAGNETWIADASGASDDGGFTNNSVASLPFQPVDGYIYSLTVTATHSGSGWIGAGFAKTHSTAELAGDNDGLIWGLTRPLNNNQVAHLNPSGGANNIAMGSDSTNPSAITIVLDTTEGTGLWDAEWFVNGTSFHRVDDISVSFETAINAVKVHSGYGANTIDSFVLNVSVPSTLLYEHTFDGSASTLDGTAVDIATAGNHGIGNLWAADTDALMDGSFDSNAVASLPFTPEHGHVYALNVSGTYHGSGWIGLGFAGSNATNPLTSNGLIWGLTRPGTAADQVAHFDASGGINNVKIANDETNPSTIAIVLDTRDGTGLWDVEWFVDGVSFHRIDDIDPAFETGIHTIKLQSGFGANTYNWIELWVD